MKKVLICAFSGIIILAFIIRITNGDNGTDEDVGRISPFVSDEISQSPRSGSGVSSKKLIRYEGFTVLYNTSTRQPVWVDYTLTKWQVAATDASPKIPHRFKPDPDLSIPQASNDDYRGINKQYGLSRGHMARHQDMKWSVQAAQESDYYTNICPQHEKLNNGLWKKIENRVRDLAMAYDSVHIVCGPIFVDTSYGFIGPNHIPVPDYFFKTLLVKDASGYHAIAFICPNCGTGFSIEDVRCTVDYVEAMTKLDFYSYLPDKLEEYVESR